MKKAKKKAALEAKQAISQTTASTRLPRADKKTVLLGLVLVLVCFGLYINTVNNSYALDDAMMITENNVTLQGYDGIKDQFSHSFLYGFLGHEGEDAASSHWRPLAMVTYSIEIGLWGINQPGKAHFFNMLLYMGIVLLFFGILRKWLLKNDWLAFFAALLYAIQPIHTEVVANIKGRDELLCLFFLLLSLGQLWKFVSSSKSRHYIFSLLLFFVSLMAKENSITFLAGIPLMLYFFTSLKRGTILKYTSGFVGVLIFFILIRNAIVPVSTLAPASDITNNPFLHASTIESFCTKLYAPLIYLRMLVWPYPLSYDYSFNQIPLKQAGDVWVWISLAIYLALFIWALAGIKKKSIISFCILMFFITLSLSTNFIVEIGMIVGERMLFIPSLFDVILTVVLVNMLLGYIEQKFGVKKMILATVFIIPVFIASSWLIINRNAEWKNDVTLNLADVRKCPNSARLNAGAGGACITASGDTTLSKKTKDSFLLASIPYFDKAIKINPGYSDALGNMGVAYARMDSFDLAEITWNKLREKEPNHRKLAEFDRYLTSHYYYVAEPYGRRSSFDTASYYLEKAARYASNPDSITYRVLYNLGGVYLATGKYQKAVDPLEKLYKMSPGFLDVGVRYNNAKQLAAQK